VVYEWDWTKATANLKKHKVTFTEAATVFLDPMAVTYQDPDHSEGEHRYVTAGESSRRRVILVAHLDRGDRIRIISARRATRKEAHEYAEAR
jgi:uncharacterized DUF497 family protein